MNTSISILYNMGGAAFWQNPNIWVGDMEGNPMTPVSDQPAYLWCQPKNTGTVIAQDVTASFWVLVPNSKLRYEDVPALGTAFVSSMQPGSTSKMRCSIPWIPDRSTGSHKCIVVVISCLNCPPPELVPGEVIPKNDPQIGQRNTTIQTARRSRRRRGAMSTEGAEAPEQLARPFHVRTDQPAMLQLLRVPLQLQRIDLEVADVPNDLPDAPGDKEFYLLDTATNKNCGFNVQIEPNKDYHFEVIVVPSEIIPGTGALYQVSQIENGEVVGGVSHVIKHL